MYPLRSVPPADQLTPVNPSDLLTLQLELATPMFGGGVQPAQIDLEQPIRPSAVRAHLRFWWRATAGAQYTSITDLFAAEAAIWGATEQSSRVGLSIDQASMNPDLIGKIDGPLKSGWISSPRPRKDGTIDQDNTKLEPPEYALFSIQEPDRRREANVKRVMKQDPHPRLLAQHSFDLTLSNGQLSDKHWKEVKLAVCAWILFGGVGARTRRGLGSLCCMTPRNESLEKLIGLPADATAEQIGAIFHKILSGLPALPPGTGQSRPWPILQGAQLFLGKKSVSPTVALSSAVGLYKEFRQQREPGNKRSYWPEPEAIRNTIGRVRGWHGPVTPPDPCEFPRALLGLPIVTHFKDGPFGDPADTTLGLGSGKQIGRLASPLIVKALPVAPGKARTLFLLLNYDVATSIAGKLTLVDTKSSAAIKSGLTFGNVKDPLDLRPTGRAKSNNTLRDQILTQSFAEVTL